MDLIFFSSGFWLAARHDFKKKYTSSFSASIISKAQSELTERKAEVVLENQVHRQMFCGVSHRFQLSGKLAVIATQRECYCNYTTDK